VLWKVVADTDGLRQTLCLHLLHLLPSGLVFFFAVAEEGAVDQIAETNKLLTGPCKLTHQHLQIHVVHLQLLQARLQGSGNVANVGYDLSGHKELLPSDT